MTRSVMILGYAGVQALDLAGPFDVFSTATLALAGQGRTGDGYSVTVTSVDGQPVATLTGLEFVAAPRPDPHLPIDTIVIPGGIGADAARANPAVVDWIKTAAHHARRVVSVCTGAFLAAQAGLLDGCPATTHWSYARRMADEFPSVAVDPEPIFVRSSDRVWTAAGVTAGIDLALALVEDDYGTEVAQTVARYLVLYLRRPGGQTQFAAPVRKCYVCHRVRPRWLPALRGSGHVWPAASTPARRTGSGRRGGVDTARDSGRRSGRL
ncbi:GlxA family transcriptional regulator, partial [Mycolicibacterium fortuitum]|uniref:GlxA family transcriptional regulator n=2 Tax=Mycolicibacterium fortuitum TaxID=1766 RepID=UPI001F401D11